MQEESREYRMRYEDQQSKSYGEMGEAYLDELCSIANVWDQVPHGRQLLGG